MKPLAGKRILVGRARPNASALAESLRNLGADVIEAPLIGVEVLKENFPGLLPFSHFEGEVFASAEAVESWLECASELERHALGASWLFAVGRKTTEALRHHGFEPAHATEGLCLVELQSWKPALQGRNVQVFTAEDGQSGIVNDLRSIGANVQALAIYRVSQVWPNIAGWNFDAVVLPSSTSARAVLSHPALRNVPAAAIGPRTVKAARESGAREVIMSPNDSVESLVKTVCQMVHQYVRS